MASFADVLMPNQAEAIHHYLIARANADWEGQYGGRNTDDPRHQDRSRRRA